MEGAALRFALYLPNFGVYADPEIAVQLAVAAEASGWDGYFLWDHINPFPDFPVPVADPWILLAAIAQATSRIKIGTTVTPLPRRRPWKVARETATLDRLSRGRLILGVGLGFPPETEFIAFGEEPDLRIRAEKLDEGLEILEGLWSGEPFEYSGRHYKVDRTVFHPTPVQQPRIPIWVAGTWPKAGPMRRAARYDGFFPLKMDDSGDSPPMTPEEVAEARARIEAMRPPGAGEFDIVLAETYAEMPVRDLERIRAMEAAGATWWGESPDTRELSIESVFEIVRLGPPVRTERAAPTG